MIIGTLRGGNGASLFQLFKIKMQSLFIHFFFEIDLEAIHGSFSVLFF